MQVPVSSISGVSSSDLSPSEAKYGGHGGPELHRFQSPYAVFHVYVLCKNRAGGLKPGLRASMAAIFGFTFCTVGDWKISLHIYYIYTGAYGKGGPGGPWTPQSTFLPRPLGAFYVNSVGSFWEEEEGLGGGNYEKKKEEKRRTKKVNMFDWLFRQIVGV